MSTKQIDINGYPGQAGDLIKIYHFTDRRKRKHYRYKPIVLVNGFLYAMNINEIASMWKDADKCLLSCFEAFEIVSGYGPKLGADF